MADTKITALTALTAADPANDVIPIVDVNDTIMAGSGTTKKISINNILGASGTATLASATVSGDLTVRTSKLQVTSTGVGIGGASAAYPLEINGGASASTSQFKSSSASVITRFTDGTGETGYVGSGTSLISGISRTDFGIASNGALVFGVSTGLAMTLNSTGLGVGGSPVRKFTAYDTSSSYQLRLGFNTSFYYDIGRSSSDGLFDFYGSQSGATGYRFGGVDGTRLTIDSSGNVGIGIAPSAWATSTTVWRALDLQYSCGLASSGAGSGEIDLLWNAYYDQTDQRWEFKYAGDRASRYAIGGSGVHAWYNTASTGTVNGQITWTQAMTLESTGSLVLGAAAVATTATDGFLYIPGCAGTPTGTPTAKTGRVPLVVDTTNNKLYFYSGGAWVAAN